MLSEMAAFIFISMILTVLSAAAAEDFPATCPGTAETCPGTAETCPGTAETYPGTAEERVKTRRIGSV